MIRIDIFSRKKSVDFIDYLLMKIGGFFLIFKMIFRYFSQEMILSG
jgi:hypothetical protein